jgi:hypothetical protein
MTAYNRPSSPPGGGVPFYPPKAGAGHSPDGVSLPKGGRVSGRPPANRMNDHERYARKLLKLLELCET